MNDLNANQLLQEAVRQHTAGQILAAERLYRRVLKQRPDQADACNLLGVIAAQRGELPDAEQWFQQSLRSQPHSPFALFNYASLLFQAARYQEAASLAERALEMTPGNAAARELRDDITFAHGCEATKLGRWQEGAAHFRSLLDRQPGSFESWINLAVCQRQLGVLEDAARSTECARSLQPGAVAPLLNLGMIHNEMAQSERAREYFEQALALAPNDPLVHNNIGVWHIVQRQPEEAIRAFKKALALRPDYANAHVNLGAMLLLRGDFDRGWREFEWRWTKWRQDGAALPQRGGKRWSGADIAGKTILLHAEQGLGDTLQFVRFVALVKERGASTVLLECQPPLARLLRTVEGVDQIFVQGDALPAYHLECPLMSLPLALHTRVETLPQRTPYIEVPSDLEARWHERLQGYPGLKVGLVWAGNPKERHDFEQRAADRRRSLALKDFLPVLRVPGATFFSLQKDDAAAQLADLPDDLVCHDFMHEVTDFADTAAFVANLDLVITVDTSVAHLAGALAKPVWVLSRFDGCWRWLLDRDDSPWYPSLRLFRQQTPSDWSHVVQSVAHELKAATPASRASWVA